MSKGKKKRIGVGMKPRGKQNTAPALSTNEGQEKGILDPVLGASSVVESVGSLAPENVQNLESSVASEPTPLEGLLESSKDDPKPEGTVISVEGPDTFLKQQWDEAKERAAVEEVLEANPRSGVFVALGETLSRGGESATMSAKPGGMTYYSDPKLGEQPDGSFKVAVRIQEGYIGAVKEWAEADGLSIEDWLSSLVHTNIETYGQPAKAR
jgi:hypothetical protein